MTGQDWIDVRIRTSIDAGELIGLLGDPAVQGSWEENGTLLSTGPDTTGEASRSVGCNGC
jgi:hypothetical protein